MYIRILFFLCISISGTFCVSNAKVHGSQREVFSLDKDFQDIDYKEDSASGTKRKTSILLEALGKRRSTSNYITTTVLELNDTHHSGLIHWAGGGSDLVICMLHDMVVTPGSPSSVFISLDYANTFHNISGNFTRADGAPAVVSRFFEHPEFNDIYVFIDKINKLIFVTENIAHSVRRYAVDFVPSDISFDPHRRSVLLAYDENIQSVLRK